MTIQKIDIPNFGSFKNFSWNESIRDSGRNILTFKRLNIIYGRNYSGKTTLSRIFRSLETGRVSSNYTVPSFTITGDNGSINQSTLGTHNYDIRVYNKDFVNENLSFLVNQDGGEIKTFAIVGEKNKAIEEDISQIENILGSVEGRSGLKHDLETKKQERDRLKESYKKANDNLEAKLRSHANNIIKPNRDYGIPTYNIDGLKKDILLTKKPGFIKLSEIEVTKKNQLNKTRCFTLDHIKN